MPLILFLIAIAPMTNSPEYKFAAISSAILWWMATHN